MVKLPVAEERKVVAVIPAYNEEQTIKEVVAITARYVDQVIVIDDGSLDSTARRAKGAGADVYRHHRNRGYGVAVKFGLKLALEQKASTTVLLDADGQHDPNCIPSVLEPINKGEVDIVIGTRFLGYHKCIPLIRRFGISFVNWLFNRLFRSSISDTQSGFRAFSLRALNSLELKEKGMGISIEVLAKAMEKKLVMRDISVPCSE